MRLPKEVLAQRCFIAWSIFCRPCSGGRYQRPSLPWEVGVYMTAIGILQLYPMLLRMRGVVMDCTFSNAMVGKKWPGKGR